jgi:hypothetical protein
MNRHLTHSSPVNHEYKFQKSADYNKYSKLVSFVILTIGLVAISGIVALVVNTIA